MKNSLAFTCLILFLHLSTTLSAQGDLPENFYHNQLNNGLEVLVVEDPTVPLATIQLAFKTGSVTENAQTNGLAHLFEHMFFKANEQYNSREAIENKIQELGIIFNATTGIERASFTINLSSHEVDNGLEFMSAAIQHPLFADTAIKSEHPIIEAKFQQAESNPVHFLIQDIDKKLWGNQWHRKNALGNQSVISNATPEQLAAMHRQYYVPSNSILIISGNVSHQAIFDAVQRHFSNWKAPERPPHEQHPVPDFSALTRSEGVITLNQQAQSPIIIAAFHGPDTRTDRKATYAADVLTYLLSQSNSTLNQNLVASGLAYQIGVGYATQKYGAPLTIFMVPKADGISAAMEELDSNLSNLNSPEYFTDDEIENAKRMLIIQELYSRETPSELVHNISFWWASADIDYFTDYTANISSVTRDDLNNLIRSYIQGQPNVTGVMLTPQLKDMLGIETFQPLKTIKE